MKYLIALSAISLAVCFFLKGMDDKMDALSIPPVHIEAPKPHAKLYFEHLADRQLAEVYNLTPENVHQPIALFKKGD